MRRRLSGRLGASGLALLALFAAAAPAGAQAPGAAFAPRDETAESLPDHQGREETFGYCSACHAYRLVANQGMSRERWDETLVWMTERHNLPVLEADDRTRILDYLSAAHPQKPASRAGGFRNPFAGP